jgi:N6-adenosine-specific RNA methylase IME4
MTGPDCVLFMWAFAPMLLDAVQLMQARPGREAWGNQTDHFTEAA